ncbi:MAG: hypothetical protein N3A38_03935 [Planctomycetota bacterium]|nr:hypothetical protein [Planctomycetota bacterium]
MVRRRNADGEKILAILGAPTPGSFAAAPGSGGSLPGGNILSPAAGGAIEKVIRRLGFRCSPGRSVWERPEPSGAERDGLLADTLEELRAVSASLKCALANLENSRRPGYQPWGPPELAGIGGAGEGAEGAKAGASSEAGGAGKPEDVVDVANTAKAGDAGGTAGSAGSGDASAWTGGGEPGGRSPAAARAPRRMYGRVWAMRTGIPMDVAISDGADGMAFFRCFFPAEGGDKSGTGGRLGVSAPDANGPVAGYRASIPAGPASAAPAPGTDRLFFLTRDGRICVDRAGRLRIASGILDSPVESVPPDAKGLRICGDGRVECKDESGMWRRLGRIELSVVSDPVSLSGEGVVFREPGGTGAARRAFPGEPDGPVLMPGFLEMPSIDISLERSILASFASLRAVLLGLAGILESGEGDAGGTRGRDHQTRDIPLQPSGPVAPRPREEDMMLFDDLPWTAAHLKALGIPVSASQGCLSISLENRDAVVEALTAVLQGLRRRLSIIRENIANADRARDAQGNLNPYQRKRLEIGARGRLIESLDPSEFRKIYRPGAPDADEKGFVTLPNVHIEIEQADLRAAMAEYAMVREALRRLAPTRVFPDPVSPLASGGGRP